MAVKVGNSWVSEAALSYAKVKADSGESATLNGLLDRYPGVNFSTNTQAFSQKGTNNIQIAPIILAQMQNNPDKRIEYEALIYDCAKIDLKRRHGLGACRFPCESGRNDHQCGWQCERLGDHGRR